MDASGGQILRQKRQNGREAQVKEEEKTSYNLSDKNHLVLATFINRHLIKKIKIVIFLYLKNYKCI